MTQVPEMLLFWYDSARKQMLALVQDKREEKFFSIPKICYHS